jgi:hypothetical protein
MRGSAHEVHLPIELYRALWLHDKGLVEVVGPEPRIVSRAVPSVAGRRAPLLPIANMSRAPAAQLFGLITLPP